MLFNSFPFLFQFLPIVLIGCFLIVRRNRLAAKIWLVGSSFFFYSWWFPPHLIVILSVMLFTYGVGQSILHASSPRLRKGLLIIGLTTDLAVLGYFKYFNFFAGSLNVLVGTAFRLDPILLPLAISFFTFQKVAFLMDVYRRKIHECPFWDYCLFVAFFPQLIAGPIVHYREVVPQFLNYRAFRFQSSNLSVGFTLFVFGLFKKVIIADSLAPLANTAFDIATNGKIPTMCDGWLGTTAYALQLYFDFSGYSDMAIGLARIFGILLPLNFNSPYKAASISEFWRRWHITLSNFLRDYLYIPLGGNRCGGVRQFSNLALTMFVGGLWHGAGWTFVLWGILHGLFLAINHAWNKCPLSRWGGRILHFPAWVLTFLSILMAWVFFRASTIQEAWRMLSGMFQTKKVCLKVFEATDACLVVGILILALVLPNTQQILSRFKPALDFLQASGKRTSWLLWRPDFRWAIVVACMFGICICSMVRPSQFLYFQF